MTGARQATHRKGGVQTRFSYSVRDYARASEAHRSFDAVRDWHQSRSFSFMLSETGISPAVSPSCCQRLASIFPSAISATISEKSDISGPSFLHAVLSETGTEMLSQ